MDPVYVKKISGYHLRAEIDNFVCRTITSHPDVMALLKEAGRHRLIVMKPNWVQESHEQKLEVWEPVITHPAVIASVARCLAELLEGPATIAICDGPHTYASFDKIIARGDLGRELAEVQQCYPNLTLELLDLRRETWIRECEVIMERRKNPDDPRGYVKVNLGKNSRFYGYCGEGRYYGAYVDTTEVNAHHHGEIHEYLLAGTPMACDLFINLPKMKTHKKTGITCCLKNLVGINGNKNWLPHHVEGTPMTSGDEFPSEKVSQGLERALKKRGQELVVRYPWAFGWIFKGVRRVGKMVIGDSDTVIRNGNWDGNDTCWRMVHDLNKAMLYGNMDGSLRKDGPTRLYLAIVDGIVGGQGNGPLCPDPVKSQVLVSGNNPVQVDLAVSRLMGFNPRRLKLIARAFESDTLSLAKGRMEDVRVALLDDGTEVGALDLAPVVQGGFRPHFGWISVAQG